MPKRNNAPTKAELARLVHDLQPGQRVTVSSGIQVSKDSSGRLRFQWKVRIGGRGSKFIGDTVDSYEEAAAARVEAETRKSDNVLKRRERGRKTKIEELFQLWWRHVITLERSTQIQYGRVWAADIYPHFKGLTMGQLLDYDGWSEWERWLCSHHVKRDGSSAHTGVDRAYEILFRVLEFAIDEGLLPWNPLEPVIRKRRKRDKQKAKRAASSLHVVARSEIPKPLDVELIRLTMRGDTPLIRQRRRAMITLLAWLGLRPGELLFLRWYHLRSRQGPLGLIRVQGAVKDIGFELIEGDTKTHTNRDVPTFEFIDAELEALYNASGRPRLDSLVFPNVNGGLLSWNNFRRDCWLPALTGAGIIEQASTKDPFYFHPYQLRHHSVSVQLHATRPDGRRYSPAKVAEAHGHTIGVLHGIYEKVYDTDMLDVAGETVEAFALAARRAACGPMPGDPGFELVELTTAEVSELTGISISSLGGRCARGSIECRKVNGRYLIPRHALLLGGLCRPSEASLGRCRGTPGKHAGALVSAC